jgi:hypothetical protein
MFPFDIITKDIISVIYIINAYNMYCRTKIIVFDVDETLGYFMELGMFWDALTTYIKNYNINIQVDQSLFNKLLDLYPEFLRPNILGILAYIKKKKQSDKCDKLMIYTNNQGPPEWVNHIVGYFEDKLNYKIVDQVIAAFKIRGKRVELCRTTGSKTRGDLIKCTGVPESAHICFLDDVYYPDMAGDNIYYINTKPYVHDLKFETMIERFLDANICDYGDATLCRTFLSEFLEKYHYIYVAKTNLAQEVDKTLSKKILMHLRVFFGNNDQKTRRHKMSQVSRTKRGKTRRQY